MSGAPQILINGRATVRRHIGGVERYAQEMARRLPLLAPERYRVLRPPAALAHRAGHVWEQLLLPRRAGHAAALYSPANLAPVLYARNAVVIHDLAALRHPEAYSRSYVAYQRRMLTAIAARARLLLTVSEFSRRELSELLELDPGRIAVVPGGVDERFRPGLDAQAVRERLALQRPYVLVLGTASARKNLQVLAPVERALRREGVELVLAGADRGYLRGTSTSVRRLGYVPEPELPALLGAADALLMPSVHEGFGLPCLEAMACGTPVVAAACGALPETCGGAAELVAPTDAGAIADALSRLHADPELHRRQAERGLRRAAQFPWSRTAQLTDRALRRLL